MKMQITSQTPIEEAYWLSRKGSILSTNIRKTAFTIQALPYTLHEKDMNHLLQYSGLSTESEKRILTKFAISLLLAAIYCNHLHSNIVLQAECITTLLHGQVVPADQCLPSLLLSLGFHVDHLDHLFLALHPDHPFLEAPEQCIYLVW